MSDLKIINFQLDMQYQKIIEIGTLVQNDFNSNVFKIKLTKEGKIYDLTGITDVKISIRDDEQFITLTNCTVDDAVNGVISVTIPDNCVDHISTFTGEIQVSFGAARLTSSLFQYEVRKELGEELTPS